MKIPLHLSKKVKDRNSNVELFRLIAAFYVLVVHWNGWFVGGMPDSFDFQSISTFRLGQAFIQSLTCVCVNLFLLITGYFGIKLKWQFLLRIYLLLISIYIPFYVASCFIWNENFSLGALIWNCYAFSKAGYFVQCYVMLMFMSPVLNSFIEQSSRKRVLGWTLGLVFIAGYFDFWRNIEALDFNRGYAILHFVLIYMLGRTIFLFQKELLSVKWLFWLIGYLLCSLGITTMYMFYNMNYIYSYTCPLVVASSACLFLPFLYHTFNQPFINWLAKGVFSVYIIQVTNPVHSILRNYDNELLANSTYVVYWLSSLAIILSFMLVCIMYDQFMSIITTPIENKLVNLVKVIRSKYEFVKQQ